MSHDADSVVLHPDEGIRHVKQPQCDPHPVRIDEGTFAARPAIIDLRRMEEASRGLVQTLFVMQRPYDSRNLGHIDLTYPKP